MALERLELLSSHACFGGEQRFYKHFSVNEIGLPMRFGLYLPPQALEGQRVPLLTFLAGLTCTEETFAIKAGAQREAARLGLALLTPDTSPRHTGIDGEDHHWDFGVGAGFYLDATEHPWAGHWQMESYLIKDLIPGVVADLRPGRRPARSFRAFDGRARGVDPGVAPPWHVRQPLCLRAHLCADALPWGRKAFLGYLGQDEDTWATHDASRLMADATTAPYPGGILIDQGLADSSWPSSCTPRPSKQPVPAPASR
jgi:S-formylglutathione hydrolase